MTNVLTFTLNFSKNCRTICKCAKLAQEANYEGFAIVFWGECWGYNNIENVGKRVDCKNHAYGDCVDEDEICVGKAASGFVYMFDKQVGMTD